VKPETDAELINRLRAGNRKALGMLYERYKQPLYAFCFRLLKNQAKAEDAVHEVFLKLHEGNGQVVQPERIRCWLFTVARNEALMSLRKSGHTTPADDDSIWDEETPLSVLTKKERATILQDVLDELKIEYREALLLREFEGLSYAQIAAVTGDSESSVKSRLFKARKALAVRLSPLLKERPQ
jgi:RNA polymerase sigma-70 factor (ECF subfamily)